MPLEWFEAPIGRIEPHDQPNQGNPIASVMTILAYWTGHYVRGHPAPFDWRGNYQFASGSTAWTLQWEDNTDYYTNFGGGAQVTSNIWNYYTFDFWPKKGENQGTRIIEKMGRAYAPRNFMGAAVAFSNPAVNYVVHIYRWDYTGPLGAPANFLSLASTGATTFSMRPHIFTVGMMFRPNGNMDCKVWVDGVFRVGVANQVAPLPAGWYTNLSQAPTIHNAIAGKAPTGIDFRYGHEIWHNNSIDGIGHPTGTGPWLDAPPSTEYLVPAYAAYADTSDGARDDLPIYRGPAGLLPPGITGSDIKYHTQDDYHDDKPLNPDPHFQSWPVITGSADGVYVGWAGLSGSHVGAEQMFAMMDEPGLTGTATIEEVMIAGVFGDQLTWNTPPQMANPTANILPRVYATCATGSDILWNRTIFNGMQICWEVQALPAYGSGRVTVIYGTYAQCLGRLAQTPIDNPATPNHAPQAPVGAIGLDQKGYLQTVPNVKYWWVNRPPCPAPTPPLIIGAIAPPVGMQII